MKKFTIPSRHRVKYTCQVPEGWEGVLVIDGRDEPIVLPGECWDDESGYFAIRPKADNPEGEAKPADYFSFAREE